jgi:hypothetical protein
MESGPEPRISERRTVRRSGAVLRNVMEIDHITMTATAAELIVDDRVRAAYLACRP